LPVGRRIDRKSRKQSTRQSLGQLIPQHPCGRTYSSPCRERENVVTRKAYSMMTQQSEAVDVTSKVFTDDRWTSKTEEWMHFIPTYRSAHCGKLPRSPSY